MGPTVSSMTNVPALTCVNLCKRYGETMVLHEIGLTVQRSSAVCLRGPNGVGKSTLLRCMSGEEKFDRGHVVVNGVDLVERPEAAKSHSGYASDEPYLYPYLTGREHLDLWAALRAADRECLASIMPVADAMAIGAAMDREVRGYSRGMRQQLGFLGAVFHRPALILLDEPFTATDAESTQAAVAFLSDRIENGAALLFSTHDATLHATLATETFALGATAPEVPGAPAAGAEQSGEV